MVGIAISGRSPLALLLIASWAAACSSTPQTPSHARQAPSGAEMVVFGAADSSTGIDTGQSRGGSLIADRKIVRNGVLVIELADLADAQKEVERAVAEAGGYVDHSSSDEDASVFLSCRVPANQLDASMERIASLGKERRRSTSSSDVTDTYADLETRIRNNAALRDRLQQLLKRATKVEDVLAIEKELNRVQSELESMQGQLDRLKSRVALSELEVWLQRKTQLGPLGYVGYGVWWAVSKLFVID